MEVRVGIGLTMISFLLADHSFCQERPKITSVSHLSVAVRSTLTAGTIPVTAKRDDLNSAQIQITSKPVVVTDGIASFWPQQLQGLAEK
jgi:hypothetical protein